MPIPEAEHVFRYTEEFSETLITAARGACVYDRDGREILDFTSGQMSAILGHAHPEIVATVSEAVARLAHLHSSFLSDVVVDFADALSGLLPESLSRVLPLSTGGESNEAALRMAKLATGRYEIVAFDRSWHGVTGGASAATFNGARRGYGPPVPGALALPSPHPYRSPFATNGEYDWRSELDWGFEMIDRQSTGSLAAMVAEPILSSGGIIEPPEGYFAALAEHCRARGMLLIFDEAQTGLGRTGDRFAFEHEGVVPDILTLSKTLGAGLPLSATVASAELEQTCHENAYLFYTTHAADPLPAAVGRRVIEVLVRDRLEERARELGRYMKGILRGLQQRHEAIGDVRGPRPAARGGAGQGSPSEGTRARAGSGGGPALHRARGEPQHRAPGERPRLPNRSAVDGHPRADRHRDGHPRPGVDRMRDPLSFGRGGAPP